MESCAADPEDSFTYRAAQLDKTQPTSKLWQLGPGRQGQEFSGSDRGPERRSRGASGRLRSTVAAMTPNRLLSEHQLATTSDDETLNLQPRNNNAPTEAPCSLYTPTYSLLVQHFPGPNVEHRSLTTEIERNISYRVVTVIRCNYSKTIASVKLPSAAEIPLFQLHIIAIIKFGMAKHLACFVGCSPSSPLLAASFGPLTEQTVRLRLRFSKLSLRRLSRVLTICGLKVNGLSTFGQDSARVCGGRLKNL